MTQPDTDHKELLGLTADIASAHFGNNTVPTADVSKVIEAVYETLAKLSSPKPNEPVLRQPAVSIRSSIKPDYLVCLEDGKKMKMLKRHLRTVYNLSPEEYRAKWGLADDYPMVAPNYAEQRRKLAKQIGLGTIRTQKVAIKRAGRPRKDA